MDKARRGKEKTWALQFYERAAHHYHDDTLQKPLTLKNNEEKKHTQVQIMPFFIFGCVAEQSAGRSIADDTVKTDS